MLRYNCFLCNFDICSGCAKSMEAQNVGQDQMHPGNSNGSAACHPRSDENSRRVATTEPSGAGGDLSNFPPSLERGDEKPMTEATEKEKKMELNIMEEMREDLKDDERMVEEMRLREELKLKEDKRVAEEMEAKEELKLSEERRLREELKIKEDQMVQQRMKLKGFIKEDIDGPEIADENQNTTVIVNPLRQGSLILEDDNIPLIDVCISSEEEEEEEEVEEVAPLPASELDPWRPKSGSLSLRQDGGG